MPKPLLVLTAVSMVFATTVAVAVTAKYFPTYSKQFLAKTETDSVLETAVVVSPSPSPSLLPTPTPSPSPSPAVAKTTTAKPKPTTDPNALDLHLSYVNGYNQLSGPGVVSIYKDSNSYISSPDVRVLYNSGSWLVAEARNNGKEVAKNVVYSVSVDGQFKTSFTKDQINPGEAVAVALITMGTQLAPIGTHNVTVSINPGKTIVESRYDNNALTFKLKTLCSADLQADCHKTSPQ